MGEIDGEIRMEVLNQNKGKYSLAMNLGPISIATWRK